MRRRRAWALSGRSASPSKTTRPPSGAINPAMSRSTVDLPQPLGPIRTVVVPSAKSSESGASAKRGLSVLAAFSRRIMGSRGVYAVGLHRTRDYCIALTAEDAEDAEEDKSEEE